MGFWSTVKKVGGTVAKAAVNPLGTAATALGAPPALAAALNPVGALGGAAVDAASGKNPLSGIGLGGPDIPQAGAGGDTSGGNFQADRTRNLAFQDRLMGQAADAGKFAAPQVQTQDVGAPTQVQTQQVGPVAVNDAQGQQIRQRQLGAVDTLQAAANGTAPSVAQQQLHQAVGGITRQGLGMASQARGADAAAARRSAILGGAQAQGKAALDSAMLGAQEQATARGQLTGALSDIRGTDTSVAAKNADLDLSGQTTNASNAGVNDRFNSGQATEVATGNANRNVGVQSTNATNALGANAQNVNERQGYNDAILRGSGQVGTATGTQANIAEEDLKRQTEAASKKYEDQMKLAGGIAGSGGAILGGLVSDRRAKTDIKRDSAKDRREFLGALKSFGYRYKDEDNGEGEFHGGMAQDLEKTKIGRNFVKTAPDGTKRVMATRFEMALAGAIGDELRSR